MRDHRYAVRVLLTALNISKSHGLRTLFDDVTLSIDDGERIGLIGPNGAGKSTLLKIIAGVQEPDHGAVNLTRGRRVVYVPQQEAFASTIDGDGVTARTIVRDAALRGGVVHDEHEADTQADVVLGRVGFDDQHAAAAPDRLSGGWRKRLAIACALATCGGEPDLILLDEPTNHLDLEGIRWLEDLLKRSSGGRMASVFVTHDRVFLENVATRVVELNRAYPQGLLSVVGDYTEFLRRKQETLDAQARAQQSLANQVRRDLAWLARGPQARRTKSKSRAAAGYERIDELAEIRGRTAAAAAGGARVDFSGTARRTRKLIAAEGIAKSLGGRPLFDGLDLVLGVGDFVGLLGPNGSGKTTMIRVLTGDLEPDAGRVVFADPAPRIVVFSQHRREFPPTMMLAEALCPVSDQVRFRGQAMHITAWSRRFLFRDEQLGQSIASLSGGELARVHIARIMLEPADVLVLDEPTNDLDIPTLEVLEESLEDFPGALVLVTHDRAMLERLASQIVALDGRGGSGVFASVDQAIAWQQRATAPTSERSRPVAAPAHPAPVAAATARKKLSYNEQRDYDTIEQRIAEAEKRAAEAERRLGDPAVVADHAEMAEACRELEAAQALVAELYARWEELERRVSG